MTSDKIAFGHFTPNATCYPLTVNITPTAGGKVTIRNSVTSGNGCIGICVDVCSEVNVESCESSNNGADGIATFAISALVRVSRSVVTDNGGFGFNNGGGTFETYSFETTTNTNLVKGNNGGGAQTNDTITKVAY